MVGEIREVRAGLLDLLTERGYIPVIAPIGVGEDIQLYNINADTAAGHIAGALCAEKVVYLTDVSGIEDENGNLITSLDKETVQAMQTQGVISGGMLPKVDAWPLRLGVRRGKGAYHRWSHSPLHPPGGLHRSRGRDRDRPESRRHPLAWGVIPQAGRPFPTRNLKCGRIDMHTKEYIEEAEKYVAGTYGRYPMVPVRADDTHIWDADGREYTDFVSGLGVINLGHCHPKVVEAIREQAGTLMHTSNLFHIPPQIELAKRLVEASFADKAYFCNSGAEANESAVKLARKYSHDKYGDGRGDIITMLNSFHGRSLTTLAATGQPKFSKGFYPRSPGFVHVPFDDLEAAEAAITEATCAIMVEPIQGEGGVHIPSPGIPGGPSEAL